MNADPIPVYRSHPYPCPYLADREAVQRFFAAPPGCGAWYESLLSERWRRAGGLIYQPDCPGCSECQPLRLDIQAFEPSPSQRRTLRRNQDLRVELSAELDHAPALELYARYQKDWHGSDKAVDPAETRSFLGESPVESGLMLYRLGSSLVGAGWIDILPDSISSVYFAFDASQAKRRLGVFSLLEEIALGRRLGKRWLHLGFWVPACPSMAYKAEWHPHERLGEAGWEKVPPPPLRPGVP